MRGAKRRGNPESTEIATARLRGPRDDFFSTLLEAMALCRALYLGMVDYRRAWRCQQALVRARQEGRIPDLLLLLEHPPTYTLGRRGDLRNVLASPEELRALGASLCQVDRGGDVTFHGPGQLVGYPILRLTGPLRGVRAYLGALEEVLMATLADFGIAAKRLPGYTGVWVEEEKAPPGGAPHEIYDFVGTSGGPAREPSRLVGAELKKIAAIGVRISRWVTSHGFALNVNTDLRYFDYIVACGLPGRSTTSMERLLGEPVELRDVARSLARHFGERFGLRGEGPKGHLTIADLMGTREGRAPGLAGLDPVLLAAAADDGVNGSATLQIASLHHSFS